MILGSLSATKKEDRRFSDLTEEVHQVAFKLRMKTPKIYYTTQGTPSVWGFGLSKKSTFLVIHQEVLELLNTEERISILSYQLLRLQRNKITTETFVTALGLWFYFIVKFIFRNKSGIFAGAYFLSSSIAILLVEMFQSIIFEDNDIFQLDLKTVKNLSSEAPFISALSKLDCHEIQLGFNERFLLIISTLKPAAHKDFLNFFINFPTSLRRIEQMQSSQA